MLFFLGIVAGRVVEIERGFGGGMNVRLGVEEWWMISWIGRSGLTGIGHFCWGVRGGFGLQEQVSRRGISLCRITRYIWRV